jgi:hypothetical protein
MQPIRKPQRRMAGHFNYQALPSVLVDAYSL